MPRPLTIIVSGMIAADPYHGGATWAVLQYVLGLKELGHNVYFVEPIALKSLRPDNAGLADSQNAGYFHQVAGHFDLTSTCSLLQAGTTKTVGVSYEQLRAIAKRTDVLINISGMLADPALLEPIPRRVYLDLDPAFIQLWHAVSGIDMRFDAHTHFITIGQLIGTPDNSVPTCGRNWLKTFQPIVLSRWPAETQVTRDALTTVANWRGYGSIDHDGVFYGQKAHSLRPLIELPKRTRTRFEVALAIDPAETKDLAALRNNGWQLLDPAEVTSTPNKYQQFVAGSWAELGIAKSGYIASNCGWFSDRSVCYLASGRPVIAQETGFSKLLPTGEGLFAFDSAEGVLAAIDDLRGDYLRHSLAARRMAEEYFGSRRVLTRLLEMVGAPG